MKCELKEIIFESTTDCHNGCDYCGSKDILNKDKFDINTFETIVNKLSYYAHNVNGFSLNVSGGDPLLINYDEHRFLYDALAEKCELKILINPLSFKYKVNERLDNILETLSLYSLIGVSVNTIEELNFLESLPLGYLPYSYTVITNFNLDNIFEYSSIEKFIVKRRLSWQIQYTTYKGKNPKALYHNDDAKAYLFNKIGKSIENGTKLILADDLNTGVCSAGFYSLGILSNGDVVPCLSNRSWEDPLTIVGNVTKQTLEDIWINGFASRRCTDSICCKDICNAPYIPEIKTNKLTIDYTYPSKLNGISPESSNTNIAMMYGVSIMPTMVYAVQEIKPSTTWVTDGPITNDNTFRYGVTTWQK